MFSLTIFLGTCSPELSLRTKLESMFLELANITGAIPKAGTVTRLTGEFSELPCASAAHERGVRLKTVPSASTPPLDDQFGGRQTGRRDRQIIRRRVASWAFQSAPITFR
jgi:hypothetical protein